MDAEALLESLPDGVATTDEGGHIRRVNESFVRLFGVTREEISGKSVGVLFANPEEFVRSPGFWRGDGREERTSFQCRLANRDGFVFRAEVTASLVRRPGAAAVGCFHVRNIEDQRRAQDALLEVSERLKTLVAASPLAIMLLDLDGVVELWNPAAERTFGYRPEEVVGRVLPSVPPERLQEFLRDLERTGRGESLAGQETERRRRDGSVFTAAQWTAPITHPDGGARCLMLVADVNERKQMARELESHAAALAREARVKDYFLAVLSHELRNPLSPLVSASSILRQHTDGSELSHKTLDVVDRQLSKLQRLVDDLLDVSRIRSDKLEIRRESVSIGDVVDGSVQSVRALAESKRHSLNVSVAEDLWVSGDPFRLEQILGNLLHNAIKYTDTGGCIDVMAEREGERIVIRVRDTGIGIPEEARATLFLPFSQGERSLHLAEGGLGLGLALVRALVTLHDGQVFAHSDGPGRGSEFSVVLPAIEPPAKSVSPRVSSIPPYSHARRRVLLVDDNEDSVAMMSELIASWGHAPVGVHSGTAALQAIESESFDIALIDIEMPGMSGYDLANKLRGLPNGRALRLVALTGHGADSDRQRSVDAGFAHHVVKPIDPGRLHSLLATPTRPPSSRGRR